MGQRLLMDETGRRRSDLRLIETANGYQFLTAQTGDDSLDQQQFVAEGCRIEFDPRQEPQALPLEFFQFFRHLARRLRTAQRQTVEQVVICKIDMRRNGPGQHSGFFETSQCVRDIAEIKRRHT
ncbi:hypothetical protein D3C84_351190 [compost metagenome]